MSGFCFAHRALAQGYPAIESIRQALLMCDEVVVATTEAPDRLQPILSAWAEREPRLKHLRVEVGERPDGPAGIQWWKRAYEAALQGCTHRWVVRLDLDEFFHERDIPKVRACVAMAEARGAAALRTSFVEISADWRFLVEPAPFDQVRIWDREKATLAWDGSQAFPQGPVLHLPSLRCWHADLLLPPPLRRAKVSRSYATHFPQVQILHDPLFKHEPLMEQLPSAFQRLGWRMPSRLVYVGTVDVYPRALRAVKRRLTACTHPLADALVAHVRLVPGAIVPLPLPRELSGRC